MARRFQWVKDIFKKRAPLEDAVEEALQAQLIFEEQHPITFDEDQRRLRLLQCVTRALPKADPLRVKELIHQALEAAARRR